VRVTMPCHMGHVAVEVTEGSNRIENR
jgi:hypothetical protein